MEIVAFVVIAGLIGWWLYRNIDGKKSLDNTQNSALFGAERFSRSDTAAKPETAPYKIETPMPTVAPAPQPPVVAVSESVSKKPAAKKPAAKKPSMKKPADKKPSPAPKVKKPTKS